jgi:hypothetical protein
MTMSARWQSLLIAMVLAATGLLIAGYKVLYLETPLLPHETRSIFSIGAEITFESARGPAAVSMALPPVQDGIRVLSEETASEDFGYTVAQTAQGKRGEWARRSAKGKQTLYYGLDVIIKPHFTAEKEADAEEAMEEELLAEFSEPMRRAAVSLLDEVRSHSADAHSFAAELISQLSLKQPSQAARMLLGNKQESRLSLLYRLLRYENIRVRKIRGLYLEDAQRNRPLVSMLEVYNGRSWQLYDINEGKISKAQNFFIWQRGGEALLEVTGGINSKVRFSVSEHHVPESDIARYNELVKEAALIDFSLLSLPSSEQNAFKHILLVPIGALVLVLVRILIGLRTSGTFMPVLIALAFMETTVFAGVLMFVTVVGIGLVIRSYLSHLNLLLVARISAVVIVVIAIMSNLSILSYKLGIEEVLTITFFPMIILAWTIERMSILWEEEGGMEVLIQGSGSLFVAVLAYFAMSNALIAHLTFTFPELLLVVLALIILIGRYSGYRLSELLRFKSMV